MTWTLATAPNLAVRNAGLTALVAAIDGGAGPGTVQLRTGSSPGVNVAVTGTLLATVTLKDPSTTGSVTNGVATLTDPDEIFAVADGTAGYCRVLDSNGATIMDGTVTVTGGGGDLTLNQTDMITGQRVDLTGGTLTAAG